jgi:hypothetical protein
LRAQLAEEAKLNSDNEKAVLKLRVDYEAFQKNCTLEAKDSALEIDKLTNEKRELEGELAGLQAKEDPDALIPPALLELLNFYQDKYAAADVIYSGRYYETLADRKAGTVTYYPEDVRMFVTPDDFRFKNQVEPFQLAQMIKEQNGDFHKGCDQLVFLVWSFLPPHYTAEQNAWGQTEYWNTPQESYAGAPMDCEDHANRLVSYLRATGLPAKMVFNVVGDTSLGGHSTVFYFASDLKWHHIEATARAIAVLDTPTKEFTNDPLWVKSVWFRFNDQYAFSQFSTEVNANFEKQTRLTKSRRELFEFKAR